MEQGFLAGCVNLMCSCFLSFIFSLLFLSLTGSDDQKGGVSCARLPGSELASSVEEKEGDETLQICGEPCGKPGYERPSLTAPLLGDAPAPCPLPACQLHPLLVAEIVNK
ncbi:unnamed protein product, partial [Phaeothamnion confervicola]